MRRTATKRKQRNKVLLHRLTAAEAAARLVPQATADSEVGRNRYADSPLEPLHAGIKVRSPWIADHPDLLPDADCDFAEFDNPVARPEGPVHEGTLRRDIHVQDRRLRREFRGLPELALLNALTIAYLRRSTDQTAKARTLFFRLWAERADDLAPHLTPRWLVSTLRTFQEHGETDDQRLIGATGSLYGYMMRIYESERAMAGASPDDRYVTNDVPKGTFGFPDLATTSVKDNDSMSHVHTLLMHHSLLDAGAGRVLEELLTRSYQAPNVFRRADDHRARLLGQDARHQSSHWSFFQKRT